MLDAFNQYGIVPEKQSAHQVANHCMPMREDFRAKFAEGIHFLCSELSPQRVSGRLGDDPQLHWWVDFLDQFDPDAWRSKMRRAVLDKDVDTLQSLAFDDAKKIGKHSPYALLMFADALARFGETQLAVQQLTLAQTAYPDDVWLTQYLGKALMYEVGNVDYRTASRYLTAAVSLDHGNSMMHQALGEALLNLEQYDAAIKALEAALEISPDFVQAKQQLANAFQYSGRPKKAIQLYHEILEKHPRESTTIGALGAAYFRAGDLGKSVTWLEKAIELAPGDANNHLNLARAHTLSHKPQVAIKVLGRAIKKCPDNMELYQALGMDLIRAGQPVKAIPVLKTVVSKKPKSFESRYDLALAYHHAKQWKNAYKHYSMAIQLNPKHEPTRQAIKSIERWLKSTAD